MPVAASVIGAGVSERPQYCILRRRVREIKKSVVDLIDVKALVGVFREIGTYLIGDLRAVAGIRVWWRHGVSILPGSGDTVVDGEPPVRLASRHGGLVAGASVLVATLLFDTLDDERAPWSQQTTVRNYAVAEA